MRVSGHLRSVRGRRALRVAAIAGCLALGPALLAACGSVPAPASGAAPAASSSGSASGSPNAAASPSAAVAPLCQNTGAVTSLRISRIPANGHVPQEQAVFPGQVTVASPVQARAVARALCALPAMPHGILSCPAMFPGTSYQLSFTAASLRFSAVTVDATGCEAVTGAGPVRRALDPGFWRVLSVAAGISPPGQSAFAQGCAPPKSQIKFKECPALYPPSGATQGGTAGVS